MTDRFEYKVIDSIEAPGGGLFKEKSRKTLERYLNDLGTDGWEVISVNLSEKGEQLTLLGLAKRRLPNP